MKSGYLSQKSRENVKRIISEFYWRDVISTNTLWISDHTLTIHGYTKCKKYQRKLPLKTEHIRWNIILICQGTPRSNEIQKKMQWFGTHIFWLGIPQGSQKYPFGNISYVSLREILIFLICVLKNDSNLTEKGVFLAFNWHFLQITN